MTEFINISERQEFDEMLNYLKVANIMAADTETNGLRYYRDHRVISISVYFPEFDVAYNLPYRHGEGQVEVSYTDTNTPDKDFQDMTWQGSTKKQLYLQYWFSKFKDRMGEDYFENVPADWVEELKPHWGREGLVHVYHNAPFDLHMLRAEGFPEPHEVIDTMVVLHTVHGDWSELDIEAPYTYTNTDARYKRCTPEQVGTWARDEDGKLKKKVQNGNRRLKWQAAFIGLENATIGEEELMAAKNEFEDKLVDSIMHRLDDDFNKGLVYKSIEKKIEELGDDWVVINYPEVNQELLAKQRDRIRAKVELDSKANMWMLPSSKVSLYAMLDVVLTWQLYQFWLPTIKEWDNERLMNEVNAINHRVAWRMEANGFKLNIAQAEREIDRLEPVIEELQQIANDIAYYVGYPEGDVNLSSWQQLQNFFNWKDENGHKPFELVITPDKIGADWDNLPVDTAKLESYECGYIESTSRATLEDYENHLFVRVLFEYRKAKKTRDTYLRNWVAAVDPDGFVHGGMKATGTGYGRMASYGEAGNLQNVPDRRGYTVKRAVVTYDDWVLFAIDYGQLEARLAAWVAEDLMVQWGVHSNEPTMLKLFNEGVDMHAYTRDVIGVQDIVFPNMSNAEIVHYLGYKDVPPANHEATVLNACRHIAKTLNFGLLYSGGKYMASKLLRIDMQVAEVLVQKWRDLFPNFAIAQDYYTELSQTYRKSPLGNISGMYVTQPLSGRHHKLHKLPTWKWYYENNVRKGFNPREAAARKKWNNVVQGTAGYIATISTLRAMDKYDSTIFRPFANIHDAVDGYVKRDKLHIIKDVMDMMVDWPTNPVLTVDLEASTGNWQDMNEVYDIDLWIKTKGQEGYE